MPKTVKVGVHVYSVLRRTKAQMPHDMGVCDFNTLQILIQKRLRPSVAKETLLHEVLHACTYPSLNGKKVQDEDFISAVAPLLLEVLQDNPGLLRYLTQ